jgi:GAF domain-containing protein
MCAFGLRENGMSNSDNPTESSRRRYEAVVRISEALVACREPEELAKTLADLLNEFLSFEHLDVLILKENSTEIEWHAWGKGGPRLGEKDLATEDLDALPLLPYSTQETVHIADWNSDERFPHVKQFLADAGIKIGSVVRLPLTTPHRRLGILGIASAPGVTYGAEDIEFFRLVARVVAFALDDGLNLKRALAAQERAQAAQAHLQLLLNLTNRITSNLEFHELLRAIAANIREVMQSDAIAISLPDAASGKSQVLVVDFPHGRGVLREEFFVTTTRAGQRALETSKPVITDWREEGAELDAMAGNLTGRYDIANVLSFKSRCVIPRVNRGRPLGLLSTSRKTDAPFTAEEVEFLTQASGQIAIAVENALAYGRLHASAARLEEECLYLESEINAGLQSLAHDASVSQLHFVHSIMTL